MKHLYRTAENGLDAEELRMFKRCVERNKLAKELRKSISDPQLYERQKLIKELEDSIKGV